MKPTGIAWLPEVPEEWEIRPIKEIVSCNDEALGEKTPPDQKIEYVEIGDVEFSTGIAQTAIMPFGEAPSRARRIARKGDVIVSTVRTYLRAVAKITRDDLIVSTGFAVLRPRAGKIDGGFLAYACVADAFTDQVIAESTGISYPAISSTKLLRCRLPLPPLAEQRAIVAFLDGRCGAIDAVVAAKERERALLKELKKAVIAEAVTGGVSSEARFSSDSRDSRFSSNSRNSRNSRTSSASSPSSPAGRKTKPTGIAWLPEVPEEWEIRRMSSLFANDISANKDFAFKRAFRFNFGSLVAKEEIGDPEEYRAVYEKYSILKKGDIVINGLNLNYDLKSMRVACAPSAGIITSAYIICRPRDGVDYRYFTYLFKAMDSMKMFHGMGTGIRLTLSFRELRALKLPCPPLAEQRAIVAFLDGRCGAIDAAEAALAREVAALKELKRATIAEAVTGSSLSSNPSQQETRR